VRGEQASGCRQDRRQARGMEEEEDEGYLARVEAKGEAGPHGLHTIYSRPVTTAYGLFTVLYKRRRRFANADSPSRIEFSRNNFLEGPSFTLSLPLSLSLSRARARALCALRERGPTPISLAIRPATPLS